MLKKIVFSASLICVLSGVLVAQRKDAFKSIDKQITWSQKRVDFAEAVAKLSRSQQIPVGLDLSAASNDSSCEEPSDYDYNAVPLRLILDSFVSKCVGFQFAEQNGVVNIFPTIGPSSFLDVKLSKFSISEITQEDALSYLKKNAELLNFMRVSGEEFDDTELLRLKSTSVEPRISLNLKNCTVRAVLNSIALIGKSNTWITFKLKDNPEKIQLIFY